MSDGLDLGEAADYILAERPGLDEDAVWAVLNELGAPPEKSQDKIALELIARARPDVRARTPSGSSPSGAPTPSWSRAPTGTTSRTEVRAAGTPGVPLH